jgi:hypothetical protein
MTRRWTPEYPIAFLPYTRITWAGDRALLGSNSSIDLGAGMAEPHRGPAAKKAILAQTALNPGGLEAEPPVPAKLFSVS